MFENDTNKFSVLSLPVSIDVNLLLSSVEWLSRYFINLAKNMQIQVLVKKRILIGNLKRNFTCNDTSFIK